MAKITWNIFYIEYARRKEIIERTLEVKNRIDFENLHKGRYLSMGEYKLEKSYSLYVKLFKDYLNADEKTILYLYLIFPDDKKFIDILLKYDKDYKRISHLFGVSENFVKLRHLNLVNMRKLAKENYTLKLKNNN